MASFRVTWRNGASEVDVDLIDNIGYLNDYAFSDVDSLSPNKGEATNQTGDMVPVVGDWVMFGFDNGKPYATDGTAFGKGVVKDIAQGTFPHGEFDWVVIQKL